MKSRSGGGRGTEKCVWCLCERRARNRALLIQSSERQFQRTLLGQRTGDRPTQYSQITLIISAGYPESLSVRVKHVFVRDYIILAASSSFSSKPLREDYHRER